MMGTNKILEDKISGLTNIFSVSVMTKFINQNTKTKLTGGFSGGYSKQTNMERI